MSLTSRSNAYAQEFERRCEEYGIDDEYCFDEYMKRKYEQFEYMGVDRTRQERVGESQEGRVKTASKIVKEASRDNRE